MKGWIVLLIIAGVWIAYKRDHTFETLISGFTRMKPTEGVISPLARGYNATAVGATGYTSPGSGRTALQPALKRTWGVGSSTFGPGLTGVQLRRNQR